jgi:plastocyanin
LHRSRHTALAIAALAAGSIALSACGREDPDLANGKALFVERCGACHVLERAGTKGTQGPSLDSAFATPRTDGMNDRTIEGVTKRQIQNPLRGSIMPEDLVEGQDLNDVAAYVGFAAGKAGKDTGALAEAGQPKTSNKPIAAENGTLTIAATGGTAFESTAATAEAGEITFEMPNETPLPHDIAVRNGGEKGKGEVVNQGQTSTFKVSLEPGEYTFYCSVPGHEDAGMKGTLTVK